MFLKHAPATVRAERSHKHVYFLLNMKHLCSVQGVSNYVWSRERLRANLICKRKAVVCLLNVCFCLELVHSNACLCAFPLQFDAIKYEKKQKVDECILYAQYRCSLICTAEGQRNAIMYDNIWWLLLFKYSKWIWALTFSSSAVPWFVSRVTLCIQHSSLIQSVP